MKKYSVLTILLFTVIMGFTVQAKATDPGNKGTSNPLKDWVISTTSSKIFSVPSITSFTESGIDGMSVKIKGAGFTGATAVTFGGTAVSSFVVASDTEITAVLATCSVGNVAVTTAGGTATKAGFTCGSIGDYEKPFNHYHSGFLWSDDNVLASSTVDFSPRIFVGPDLEDERGLYEVSIEMENFKTFPGRSEPTLGLVPSPPANTAHDVGSLINEWGHIVSGEKIASGTISSYSSQIKVTDILRINYDAVTQKLSYGLTKSGEAYVDRGEAFSNVVAAEGEKLSIAASVNCLGSCQFRLVATAVPEIDVSGTSTSFGEVESGMTSSLTFSIQNSGAEQLNLSGNSKVVISGTNASDFSVTTQPSGSITAGNSSDFVVQFSPSSSGSKSALITIVSDDKDEGIFTFYVTGDGTGGAPTSAIVAASAFLEGAYNGTNLSANINGSLPAQQPYNGINSHSETTNVTSMPANAVDWVLVELREAASAATALNSTKVGSAAGFLMSDGSIKATDGTSDLTVSLSGNTGSEFFVVIYHRNHLSIMSAGAIADSGGTYRIDFTSTSANTHQTTTALTTLSTGKFAMPAGDADGDGDVDATDLSTWRIQNGVAFSYNITNGDFNLDGVINAVDRIEFQKKNISKTTQVPNT